MNGRKVIERVCYKCDGKGETEEFRGWGIVDVTCEFCNGTGKIGKTPKSINEENKLMRSSMRGMESQLYDIRLLADQLKGECCLSRHAEGIVSSMAGKLLDATREIKTMIDKFDADRVV